MEMRVVYVGHTAAGAALTRLFLLAFPFHAALMASGERLTRREGLTAARWQVLSAVARAEGPQTVAQVARSMGLARQSVQRVADDLVRADMLAFADNPQHKRAMLLHLAPRGHAAFEAMAGHQVPWANELATGIDPAALEAAAAVLAALAARLDRGVGE